MCPMIRDGKPPLPPSTITELKKTLPVDYGHRVVSSAGTRILAIRIPGARPDMFQDIPRAADFLGTDDTRELAHVLLIGEEKVLRVDPIPLRDEVRERTREDQQSVLALKKRLGRNYEYSIFKPVTGKGSPRLVIRIPKFKAGEVDDGDRAQIKALMAKIVADPTVRESRIFYIVTDDDYAKLGTEGFQALLEGRKNEALATMTIATAAAPPVPPTPAGQYFVADEKRGQQSRAAPGGLPLDSNSPFGGLMGATMSANEKLDLHKQAIAEKRVAPVGEMIDAREGAGVARRTTTTSTPPAQRGGGEIIDAESGMVVGKKKARPQFNSDGSVSYVDSAAAMPTGAGTIDSLISAAVSPHKPTAPSPFPGHVEADIEILPGRNATPAPQPASAPEPPLESPGIIVATPASASPPPPAAPAVDAPGDPVSAILTKLQGSGYELLDTASLLEVDAAAHKAAGKRILVKRMKSVDLETAQRLERLATDLRADACLVIAEEVAPGTRAWTMGTKVELLRPSDIGELEL